PNTHNVEIVSVTGRDITFHDLGGQTNSPAPLVGGQVIAGVFYCNSGLFATRIRYPWQVYDLNRLAEIATGSRKSWDIGPTHEWGDTDSIYPAQAWAAAPGLVFDQQAGQVLWFASSTQIYFYALDGSAPMEAAPRPSPR